MEFIFIICTLAIIGVLALVYLLSWGYYKLFKVLFKKFKLSLEAVKEGNEFKCMTVEALAVIIPIALYLIFLSPVIVLAIGLSIAHLLAFFKA